MVDCVDWPEGEGPAPYQLQTARNLIEFHREAEKGPRRLGKTTTAALIVLGFALTRDGAYDWKAVTMAGGWGQLTHFLWPEIHKWARRLRWDRIGRPAFNVDRELLKTMLNLNTGSAFGMVSDRPALIEGAGAQQYLIVYDEAKAIPDSMFDAAEGSMASGGVKEGYDTYSLMISTPPPQRAGRFYDIFARKAGLEKWHTTSVTLLDAVAAGRISAQWAEDMRLLWGEDSPAYQTYVLGEFSDVDTTGSVIPLPWVEAAVERWLIWREMGGVLPPYERCGVDIARFGADMTVIALRFGNIISELRHFAKQDLMETAGQVKGVIDKFGGPAIIDVDGMGGGVVDRLREQGDKYRKLARAFNAGGGTNKKDISGEFGFTDRRSAMWFNMREMLMPDSGVEICLPPDDKLIGDLTAPTWRVLSSAKIQVEPKDTIRKRIGRSTDDADAVCQAFWTDASKTSFEWL